MRDVAYGWIGTGAAAAPPDPAAPAERAPSLERSTATVAPDHAEQAPALNASTAAVHDPAETAEQAPALNASTAAVPDPAETAEQAPALNVSAAAVLELAERAERAPPLVVSSAYSALGAIRRRQVRVGEVTVLLVPGPAGWVREAVVDEIDLGAHLAAELDLAGRHGEDHGAGERWAGPLPIARYAAFRAADPGDADPLARAAGCPAELVRSLAGPVALGRVEVVRRDGAGRPGGPATVVADELAWVDGGADGLWTVRPGGPDDVAIERGSPADVATALAGMVRAAEGC